MKYQFNESGNNNIDYVVKKFDNQIKKEYKSSYGNKYTCESYWSKSLFIESLELTIDDWRKIRTEEYWLLKETLKGIALKKFKINRIKQYKLSQL